MTDSTMNASSGESGLDVGGTDDLFGEFEEESLPEETTDGESSDDETGTVTESTTNEVEDQTAAAVFGQLQESVSDTGDIDGVLEDESPDDIIASADEPEPEPIDDDLLMDEGELEELLLTDRTKDEEFLWVETDTEDAIDVTEGSSTDEGSETDAFSENGLESAVEADAGTGDGNDTDTAATTAVDTDDDSGGVTGSTSLTADETTSDQASSDDGDEAFDDAADADNADTVPDDLESEETALVASDTDVPATTEEDSTGGVFGWLRSKLGGLFS